jgi:small-conductance mechanosensitive channel
MYVGDNVTFGDGTAGRVAKLGWMETVLRNSDNTLTRVPNALLASQKISNVSRVAQCQVKQMLRFHYEDADVLPELLDAIRDEIKKSCSRLVTDGKQPFRVYWVNYNEDHLEVMVDTHHNIAPIGNAYWENRQNVLLAIHRAVKKFDVEFAQLYSLATSAGEPEWRVVPKKKLLAPKN